MEGENIEEKQPRRRFRKNRNDNAGNLLNEENPDFTERPKEIQEPPSEVPRNQTSPRDQERNDRPRTDPISSPRDPPARSRVPSIDLPSQRPPRQSSFQTESQQPVVEDEPKSFVSSHPDDNIVMNPENDNSEEEEEDEETGLISRNNPNISSTKSFTAGDERLKVFQDINGQVQRMKQLRDLHEFYPFNVFTSCFSCCCKVGYELRPVQRVAQFDDVYRTLNLKRVSNGLNVGVLIKQIETFKDHIIGLVKPIVRISVVNIETGFFLQSQDELPLLPATTKPKFAVNNCSKVIWNEEVVLDAPFVDIVSESSIIFFEIIDRYTSLSIKKKGNRVHNQRYQYRKVAWAYLLPIGVDGRMHINFYPLASSVPEGPTPAPNLSQIHSEENLPSNPTTPNAPHAAGAGLGNLFSPTTLTAQQYQVKNELVDNHLRLQLYSYQDYDGMVGFIQRKALHWPELNPSIDSADDIAYPNNIPSIYLQWKLLNKSRIEGSFLDIAIGSRIRKVTSDDSHQEAGSSSEKMSPRSRNRRDRAPYAHITTRRKRKTKPHSREDRNRLRNAAIRRYRSRNEPCLIPDRFLYRLNVGPEGAMAIAFSHSGHLLAIVSKTVNFSVHFANQEIVYSLRLYDTDLDEEVWLDEAAHHGTIYDLKWSYNDRFLLTCSNDGSCKIWDFIALHPLMQQYSPPITDDDMTITHPPSSPTPGINTSEPILEEGSADLSYLQQGNDPSPRSVAKLFPPRIYGIIKLPAKVYSYCGIFQEFPPAAHKGYQPNPHLALSVLDPVAATSSPVDGVINPLLDYQTWKDSLNFLQNTPLPRLIIGASDGRLRVYESMTNSTSSIQPTAASATETPIVSTVMLAMIGYISVQDRDDFGNIVDIPPHNGTINSLVIDERSRYLISADSYGDILAWRLDSHHWYQLLRKFKKDVSSGPINAESKSMANNASGVPSKYAIHQYEQMHAFQQGSVLSLTMHPERNRGFMLVLQRQPAQLKVINMTTYKTTSYCEGFSGVVSYLIHEQEDDYSTGVFYRANYSADGRYIICGTSIASSQQGIKRGSDTNGGMYQLVVWDTYTGHPVHTPLSKITFPYPIRSIAWHPSQHLLAVSMVGPSAAVAVYCTNRENSTESPAYVSNPLHSTQAASNPSDNLRSSTNSLHASSDNLFLTGKSDIQYSVLESTDSTMNKNSNNGISNLEKFHQFNLPASRLHESTNSTSSSALTTPMVKPNQTGDPSAIPVRNPVIAAARPIARATPTSAKEIEDKSDRAANLARTRELLQKYSKSKGGNSEKKTKEGKVEDRERLTEDQKSK